VDIAAVLFAHQLNFVRVVFVEHAVIKNEAAVLIKLNGRLSEFPDFGGSDISVHQEPIDGIMGESSVVICKIGLGEIHLGRNQELAIILMGRLHDQYCAKTPSLFQ
jgi:hypothetical protein